MNPSLLELCLRKTKRTRRGCQEWQGRRTRRGYGKLACLGYTLLAHRLVFHLATGKNPGQKIILHSCDNPPCVNPSHLSLGTAKENMKDLLERGTHWKTAREGISEIKENRDNLTVAELAERYDRPGHQIYMIMKGKVWANIAPAPNFVPTPRVEKAPRILLKNLSLRERIERNVTRESAEGCWIWEGKMEGHGERPTICVQGKSYAVHREVYRWTHGGLADSDWIIRCRKQKRCVNPNHMRLEARSPPFALPNQP